MTPVPVFDQFRLDGCVVIITGGAGLLGKEYARAVAEAGGHAVIVDIDGHMAELVASDVTNATGIRALGMKIDVSEKSSVLEMVQKTLDDFGKIDGLVNNAALDPKFDKSHTVQHTNSFEDFPLELWNQSIAVNITGMFLCAQAVAKPMLAQQRGSIINVSSTYGLVGPDQRIYEKDNAQTTKTYKPVTYSVTKSAVLGLTHYLATYWGNQGIRVNTLTPGGVFNNHDDDFVRRYSCRTTLGRMAKKHEYNGALVYLLSDASSYMTGSNLVVDGGWTAW